MTKKGNNTHIQILGRMKPFPPSPMLPVYLPVSSSRKMMPMIFGGIGGLILIVLISLVVLWQMGYRAEIFRFTGLFENFYTSVKPVKPPAIESPKVEGPRTTEQVTEVSSKGRAGDDGHDSGTTEKVTEETVPQVTEETMTVEAPPPIPKPHPNLLIGRYPVLKYTAISDTVRPEDTVMEFTRRYKNRIFPKSYRNYKQLAQYNGIEPPYTLKSGIEFLIPTVEHIVLPKTEYETEIQEIQSKLELESSNIELINRLGIIYFKRNELHKAASTFQKGINLIPDDVMLRNNLGYTYLLLEDDGAESELQQAIAQMENPAVPLCNLGTLHMTREKWDLAVKAFKDALEQDANLLDAKYNLALTYKEIGQIDLAKNYLDELSQLLPDDPQVQSILDDLVR